VARGQVPVWRNSKSNSEKILRTVKQNWVGVLKLLLSMWYKFYVWLQAPWSCLGGSCARVQLHHRIKPFKHLPFFPVLSETWCMLLWQRQYFVVLRYSWTVSSSCWNDTKFVLVYLWIQPNKSEHNIMCTLSCML
jgi:hypothetical protein